MKLAICRVEDVISARDADSGAEGRFSATTGERLSGTLDLPPDEVLYRAWAQTQSPRIKEPQLRAMWASRK